jgi:predicted nucleotidyltransferase
MAREYPIPIPMDAIAEFCRRNHIRKLSLFGSVLRDDFGPESDVDVLVEFEPGKTPGFEFVDMMDELGELLGRPVDLVTPKFFRESLREKIQSDAEVLYVAA